MIKVLIVDDEPKLREGLRTLIPWEDEGYTVIATAANGFEALEKFRTFTPKLIVADIRMPGMDGLELIGELRKINGGCHVIILSGYADFEYAKRAISFHIDGYLLKPVDEEELIAYLQGLRVTIEQEERLRILKDVVEESSQESWLRWLLQPSSDEIDVSRAVDMLSLKGSCEVVLIQLMRPFKGEDGREEKVRSLLEQYYPSDQAIFFNQPPFLGFLLKNPLKDEAARNALWQELSRIITKEGMGFYVASGGSVAHPEQAGMSFTVARDLLERAFFWRKEILVSEVTDQWSEAIVETEESADTDRDEEMELLLAIETGSVEVLSPLVSRMICRLVEERYEEAYIKENLIRILSSIIARLVAASPEARTLISESASPAGEVYSSYYLVDIQNMLTDYLESIAKQMNSSGRGDEIKRITDLIQRRYNENLKLGMLAQIFNYNSAYLGKMFRNQLGEHFNTYLDKVRIEKSKEFLTQGMKVYEVAERVGYMNADYFNAKFRKYVGVSPTAFRKEQ